MPHPNFILHIYRYYSLFEACYHYWNDENGSYWFYMNFWGSFSGEREKNVFLPMKYGRAIFLLSIDLE